MSEFLSSFTSWEARDWLALISAGTAVLAVTISGGVSRRALWQRANETELKAIQDQLDGFYGPLLQRLHLG